MAFGRWLMDDWPKLMLAMTNRKIYSRPVDGSGQWRLIPGRLTHVSGSGRHEVYGTNASGNIFRCKKPCIGEWEKIEGALIQCDGTFNGLFGVNSGHQIWRRNVGI